MCRGIPERKSQRQNTRGPALEIADVLDKAFQVASNENHTGDCSVKKKRGGADFRKQACLGRQRWGLELAAEYLAETGRLDSPPLCSLPALLLQSSFLCFLGSAS